MYKTKIVVYVRQLIKYQKVIKCPTIKTTIHGIYSVGKSVGIR